MDLGKRFWEWVNNFYRDDYQKEKANIEEQSGIIAPKGPTRKQPELNQFVRQVRISGKSVETPIGLLDLNFKKLNNDTIQNIMKKTYKMYKRGKFIQDHNMDNTITGTIKGTDFVAVQHKPIDNKSSTTVCTNNGFYRLTVENDNPDHQEYREVLTDNDGIIRELSTNIGGNYIRYNNFTTVKGIDKVMTLEEEASDKIYEHFYDTSAFEKYAQPSYDEELLEEYSKATGLPIIFGGSYLTSISRDYGNDGRKGVDIKTLKQVIGSENDSQRPFIITIRASSRSNTGKYTLFSEKRNGRILNGIECNTPLSKEISYLYKSHKDYREGKKPYMIYMGGIDGREGLSGMFRLLEDEQMYIDNSTFRGGEGTYSFEKCSFDDIMKLAGKMPTELSERGILATMGLYQVPEAITKIHEKLILQEKQQTEGR